MLGVTALLHRKDDRQRPQPLPAGTPDVYDGAAVRAVQPVPAVPSVVVPPEPEPAPAPEARDEPAPQAPDVPADGNDVAELDVDSRVDHSVAPDAETAPEPYPADPAATVRKKRRGKRRAARETRAAAAARAADEAAALADPDDGLPAEPDDSSLREWLQAGWTPQAWDVAPPRTRTRGRRRREMPTPLRTRVWARKPVRWGVSLVLVAGCAALPWAVPGVRDRLAGAVPEQVIATPTVHDPVVDPAQAFVGPVGIATGGGTYDGVRLASAGRPREVRVPRLHVASDVVAISGQSGALVPPDDPQVLGWWQEGRAAGAAAGSAVVTGHTVHTGGGAFDHLGELVTGDTIRVRTDAGWIRYRVDRTRVYSTAQLARRSAEIFRREGPGRLVLITCDDFNGEIYLSNAVVYATPVLDEPFSGEPAQRRGGVPVPDGGPGDPSAGNAGNTGAVPGVRTSGARERP